MRAVSWVASKKERGRTEVGPLSQVARREPALSERVVANSEGVKRVSEVLESLAPFGRIVRKIQKTDNNMKHRRNANRLSLGIVLHAAFSKKSFHLRENPLHKSLNQCEFIWGYGCP